MEPPVGARLDEAHACHDEDPARAAALLRAIDPAALDAPRWPTFAFLLDHVLGEKLGSWEEALALQRRLLAAAGEPAPAPVLRHAAAAAQLAGRADERGEICARLAACSGADARVAGDVVAATAAMYRVPALHAREAASVALAELVRFDGGAWERATPLDAAAAAAWNNIASALLEGPPDSFAHPALREALARAAELAERLWQRAGTWVNHERAAYLRAMAAHALGDARGALAHAERGLALIAANDRDDAERVDRTFLTLERAHALRRAGEGERARAAAVEADALAERFAADAELTAWFARRRAQLTALA
jgi:hypothetical protein